MELGENIKIEFGETGSRTKVYYKGKTIGGIKSASYTATTGVFGELYKRLNIEIYEPKEMYFNEENMAFGQEFIAEATRLGANVTVKSILEEFPPQYYNAKTDNIASDNKTEQDKCMAGKELVGVAIACAAISGIARLMSIGRKNKKVQGRQRNSNSLKADKKSATIKK